MLGMISCGASAARKIVISIAEAIVRTGMISSNSPTALRGRALSKRISNRLSDPATYESVPLLLGSLNPRQ